MVKPTISGEIIRIGTRVNIDGHSFGKVVAHFVAPLGFHGDRLDLYYVVELEDGFYAEDRRCFVCYLVAHADNVKAVARG